MINLKTDIKPISELKRQTKAIIDQLKETRRPIILTVNGRADSVIMDIDTYEKQVKNVQLAKLLLEAEKDVAENRTRSFDKFIDEMKRDEKIPD